jgi:3-dehydroquinate synthase
MNSLDRLIVRTPNSQYPLLFGEKILTQAGTLLAEYLPSRRVVVVTDTHVAALYGESVQHSLQQAGFTVQQCVVTAGEASKSFAVHAQLCEEILATQPDRRTTLIALGGGVVGDLTGFVAATLLRGVPFVQIPTTLLSQVDSSVGGKVAINTTAGKNLVGAFYQPRAVLMDMDVFSTLSDTELLSGYGEVVKYGLLGDAAFYAELLRYPTLTSLKEDTIRLKHIIRHCCAMKADIVEEDETEQGRRALLNLGHTFGHAIEKATHYTAPHGQTVAVGCLMAMRLSQLLGYEVQDADIAALTAHFEGIGMPTKIRDFMDSHPRTSDDHASMLTHYCYGDKKASGGALTFIVLERIGAAMVQKNIDPALVQRVFAEYL